MLTWGGPKLGWLEWSVLPMGMKQSPAVLNTALTYVLKEFEESAKHSQIVVARYICGRHFLAGDSVAVKEKWLKKLVDLLILWSFTPSKEKVQRSSEGGLVILGHHLESGFLQVKPQQFPDFDSQQWFSAAELCRVSGLLGDPMFTAATLPLQQELARIAQSCSVSTWFNRQFQVPKWWVARFHEAQVRLARGVASHWSPKAFHTDASGSGLYM
jgi:hypothetical protein